MAENWIAGAKILIVDDQAANVRYLEMILEQAGAQHVQSTTDARQVAELYRTGTPDLIVLDLMMPHLDGFAVLDYLQEVIPADSYLPILVITADITPAVKRRALAAGAHDFLTKPFDPVEALLRITNLVQTRLLHQQLQLQNDLLEERVHARTQELEQAQSEILARLTLATDYRNEETGEHAERVGHMAAQLAQVLGLAPSQVELIRRAAPLHDVGKIGITDEILLKPGPFTRAEFEEMKTHTIIGARILSGGHSELIHLAQMIALTHHERWDGTGYPRRLRGEQIPLVGRIVAVADAFDALTHNRPYKRAWPVAEAVAELTRMRGSQFDPHVVDAFLTVVDRLPATPATIAPALLVEEGLPWSISTLVY